MKILIADDDPDASGVLQDHLVQWNHQVLVADNGLTAWNILKEKTAPKLAILDVMMPGLDGISLCHRVRAERKDTYLILLTASDENQNLIAGLTAGADDYVAKPFQSEELRLRIQTGVRILNLQEELNTRIAELEYAIGHIKQLQGLLPICSYCKKIRAGANYWQQVEKYISQNADVRFSHSICPDCYDKVVQPQLDDSAPSPE